MWYKVQFYTETEQQMFHVGMGKNNIKSAPSPSHHQIFIGAM